jgi:choline kinase
MKAILLSAGRGSRLEGLTERLPKCLVEVGGRSILDHQLAALHANDIAEVVVVCGFKREAIAAHVAHLPEAERPRLVFNPFWAVASSIGSVWEARDCLAGPFCVINGDTIFDAALIRTALERLRPGINLLVEEAAPEPDDMRVAVEAGRITAVSKALSPDAAAFRSLGIVICPDADGGPYRAALERVIGGPDGHNAFHHAIIDDLARTAVVHPLCIDGGHWQEIDRQDDIAAYEGCVRG